MNSKKMKCINRTYARWLGALALMVFIGVSAPAYCQQFNTDNWLLLPHGTGMGVATVGQEYSTMYLGYGFAPKWEVDISATLYDDDPSTGTAARYSTSGFVKRLLYENEEQTGGVSVMAGIGQAPYYYQAGIRVEDFANYWAVVPVTFPFLDNAISWDIMPGVTYNKEYGATEETAWGYSYSTRLAIYKIIPQSAIVAEVFGAVGEADQQAQYKAGVRWESKYVVIALTYGDGLEGNDGAGVELGFLIFTPSYF